MATFPNSYSTTTAVDADDKFLVSVDGTVMAATAQTTRGQTLFNVLDYGASASDSVSEAAQIAAFQAAFDAAGPTGVVYAPAGTYSFGTNRFASPGTNIRGLIGDGPGKTVLKYTSADDDTWLFWIAGSAAASKTLSQSVLEYEANAGSNNWYPVVKTSTAHGFSVDDWILLGSSTAWPGTVVSATKGEIARVAELGDAAGANATTAVRLAAKVHDDYTTAASGFAAKLTMATDIVFRDFSVECTNPATGTNNTSVFLLQYAENARFENIDFYGVDEQCIEAYNAVNVRVTNCHGRRLGYSGASGVWQGTLVLARCASQDWVVSGCSAYQSWHLFTTGGAAQAGVPRNILITGCWFNGHTTAVGDSQHGAAAFDTHEEGENIYFDNCSVLGTTRYAFHSRCPHTHFTNCVSDGATEKAFWLGDTTNTFAIGCRALNTKYNTDSSHAAGFWVDGTGHVIQSCIVEGAEGSGIHLSTCTDVSIQGVTLIRTGISDSRAALQLGNGADTVTGLRAAGVHIYNATIGVAQHASTTDTDCTITGVTYRDVDTQTTGSPPIV